MPAYDIEIRNLEGDLVFKRDNVETPEGWSRQAAQVFSSKYFTKNETKVQEVFDRVMDVYQDVLPEDVWERVMGYLVNQEALQNSPVMFNFGVHENPQASGCFIVGIDDDMNAISEAVETCFTVFKYGSGAGVSFGKLRGNNEHLSGSEGVASGPISFCRVFNKVAGVIKSGGKTRRAAFMAELDVDHPNIFEWIDMKQHEEEKAKLLAQHGYGDGMDSESYTTVDFQNLNSAVALTDKFMEAVIRDSSFDLINRTDGSIAKTVQANDIMDAICKAGHDSGDPGVQFIDIINRAHAVPSAGRINGSNPCLAGDTLITTPNGDIPISELDGKTDFILHEDGFVEAKFFKTGVKPLYRVTALSGKSIDCTEDHRWAVIDYAIGIDGAEEWIEAKNLVGAPIWSHHRDGKTTETISAVSLIGTDDVYDFTILDKSKDPHGIINGFKLHNCSEFIFIDNSACNLAGINLVKTLFEKGEEYFCQVVYDLIFHMDATVDKASYPTEKMRKNSIRLRPLGLGYGNLHTYLMLKGLPYDSDEGRKEAARITRLLQLTAMKASQDLAEKYGHNMTEQEQLEIYERWKPLFPELECKPFRNATFSLLAPLGTTGFAMDLDSFGIEPMIALFFKKMLAGGGEMRIWLPTVIKAINGLRPNLSESEIKVMLTENPESTIDEIFGLNTGKLFQVAIGNDPVSPMGHIKMMGAVQPYLSGSISKTVNLPHSTTPEQIKEIYIKGWQMGLKAIAIYRAGSKLSEPIQVKTSSSHPTPERERLPNTRNGVNHKFDIMGTEGYVQTFEYPDGRPAEAFTVIAKEGSTISGLCDAFSIAMSIGLQYGIPLDVFIDKFKGMSFPPNGITTDDDIPSCQSIPDYMVRYLDLYWNGKKDTKVEMSLPLEQEPSDKPPLCPSCGNITTPRGAHCYLCPTCGDEGCGGI